MSSRRMRCVRLLAAAVALAIGALAAPALASAHPLGNFTTNRYDEVVASGDHLYVLAVLDLAEIPTFQAKPDVAELGRSGYTRVPCSRTISDGSPCRSAGEPRDRCARSATRSSSRAAPAGCTRRASRSSTRPAPAPARGKVELRDDLPRPHRLARGRRVLEPGRDADVLRRASQSVSDRLLVYPKDMLKSPLDVRSGVGRRCAPAPLAGDRRPL